MRRIFLAVVLFLATIICAMAQNDAMYVYRNDGVINAFLKAEVDSMRCSCFDLDSLLHQHAVVQEIWTVDSVYRIPIEVIDSVSFVTPPTVYKQGVKNMDGGLAKYVIGVDDMTLKLKPNTPFVLLPCVGDELVMIEDCDVLPSGFAGKVVEIQQDAESIDVVCELTSLDNIFDSYCSVSTTVAGDLTSSVKTDFTPDVVSRVVINPNDANVPLGPYVISVSTQLGLAVNPDRNLALSGGTSFTVTLQPKLRIHTFMIIGQGQGTYVNCSITGELNVNSQTSIFGGISYSKEFNKDLVNIPLGQRFVNFYIRPGAFIRANGTISSNITTTRNFTYGMAFDYSTKGEKAVKSSLGGRLVSSSTDVSACIDASLELGAFAEMGFNFVNADIGKVCVRGEYGAQLSGNFVLRNTDVDNARNGTELYERLKASSIEYGPFVNASILGSILRVEGGRTWTLSHRATYLDLVPTFSNTSLSNTKGSKTSADASADMSGNCLFPVGVGYMLFDKDDNEVENYDGISNYWKSAQKLEYTFKELDPKEKYTVYPKVNIFGFDILANPCAELDAAVFPTITNFEVTKSSYSKGAYHNDGVAYDYRFDAATTVEIESLEGVADWGYVYKDPNGRVKHISLMGRDSPYTDTSYAYFRNEPKSTACLYGYVRFEGDAKYYYGDPEEYPLEYEGTHSCPDNNHPHAIDLGLPSGTKWCCCNVGASTPEGYGGYYAWGETSEKSVYNWDTYAYGSDRDNVQNIGSDIAGTSYDVAHVKMGGSWRMPSDTQQKELMDNCTREWTSQNGVNGILVKGSNGGQIFLPAAGNRWFDYLSNDGTYGYYWSTSLRPGSDYGAYYVYFYSGDWYWGNDDRYVGLSVRAVCP